LQEGKEARELGLEELLEFLTFNYNALILLEQQTQGVPIEERLKRVAEVSVRGMADRGINERTLAQAFEKYASNERVQEISWKARDHEQKLMAEVEVPPWLTPDKLLEIMKDLQDANGEIFPQIVRAEMAGEMPPELLQQCIQINNKCYQKHGVTEMQLQTALVRYQSDSKFAAQIQAQQSAASDRAVALVAQIEAGQA
jgi:hypothetical protein